NLSDFQIEADFGGLLFIRLRRVQVQRRAECRMTSERQFLLDSEYANFLSFPGFSRGIARKNESGLRKIHLTGQCLHLRVIQSASIMEDCQRISRERRLSEHINLSEFVSPARHKTSSVCAKTRHTERTFLRRSKNFNKNS